MKALELYDAYDRRKSAPKKRYLTLTKEEILKLSYGDHVKVIRNDGRVGDVKINGKVRTWKRDPDRVEVPLKYGMYEYTTFGLNEAMDRLVKEEETHD